MVTRWVLRYWPVLAVGIVLVMIVGLAEFGQFAALTPIAPGGAEPTRIPSSAGLPSSSPMPDPTSPHIGIGFSLAGWIMHLIVTIVIVLCVIALIAAVVMLFLLMIRIRLARAHPAVAAEPPRDAVLERVELLAAIDAVIAELDDDDIDPRTAVIACWVRLEGVAAGAGIADRLDRTSSDLVAELLANQRVSADTLASFAELYRAARYSRHTIEASMRDDARSALRGLRDDITLDDRASA